MAISLIQADGVALSAGTHRRGRAAFNGGGSSRAVGGRSGFRVDTPSTILIVSTSAWSLSPCSAMIDPGASTNQGMYGWALDHTATGTPTPQDATLPRKDIYYIQVNDSSSGDGSGQINADIYYLAGTPNTNPQPPALPPRSFLIGTATIPPVGGGNPSVALNPARFAAAGAPLPVYSTAERDGLIKYDGLIVQRRDIAGRPMETWDGSVWHRPGSYAKYANVAVLNSPVVMNGQLGPFYQTFPAGRFTVAPIVTLGVSNARLSAAWNNVSKDGFDLYVRNDSDLDAVSGAIISFTAEQMTATIAAG